MTTEEKIKRTFLISKKDLKKIKSDAENLGISLNEVVTNSIQAYKPIHKKRKFVPCAVKYGQTGKEG